MISELVRPSRTIRRLIDTAAQAYVGLPAVAVKKGTDINEISFDKLAEEVRHISIILEKEFKQRKIVVLPGSLNYEWLVVYLGVIYSGRIAVPLDLSSPDEETISKIVKLKPDCIFTERNFSEAGKKLESYFPEIFFFELETWYGEKHSCVINETAKQTIAEVKPDDTAMLIFTSGTTGNNKIVELTHRNICADALLSVTYLDAVHGVSDRVLSALPMFHMYGITAPVFGSMYRGFTLCVGGSAWTLRRDLPLFQPNILLVVPDIIYNFGKKLLPAAGTEVTEEVAAAALKTAFQFFGGHLKTIICGGAPLESGYSAFFSNLGIFLMNGYGITECSPIVSCDVPSLHKDGAIGKTGIIPEFCMVKTLNDEICVKGEIVSPGYWKEPELNRMAYEDGWFKTGDLGFIDGDGYLFITGRKKNILILPDGNNISMEELEFQINACPVVDSSVVVGSVKNGTAVIKALVYCVPGNGKSEEENRKSVSEWIERLNRENKRFKRISDLELVSTPFERTALGKIKRFKYE